MKLLVCVCLSLFTAQFLLAQDYTLLESHNGKDVVIKKPTGQEEIIIKLREGGAASGIVWKLLKNGDPNVLKLDCEDLSYASKVPGAAGTRTFRFKLAGRKGKSKVVLTEKLNKPKPGYVPKEYRFTVSVETDVPVKPQVMRLISAEEDGQIFTFTTQQRGQLLLLRLPNQMYRSGYDWVLENPTTEKPLMMTRTYVENPPPDEPDAPSWRNWYFQLNGKKGKTDLQLYLRKPNQKNSKTAYCFRVTLQVK